jgi:hypothetical protein
MKNPSIYNDVAVKDGLTGVKLLNTFNPYNNGSSILTEAFV